MTRPREIPAFINRSSGSAARGDGEVGDIRAAFEAAGLKVRVKLVDGAAIPEQVQKAANAGAELVIVGGGDGTISAAAGVLAGTKTRLGILPLGTLNHFSRDLRIPLKIEEAAALIGSGSVREVDVAEVNGRTFINNSAIGLYPLMVIDRDLQQHRLGRSKRFAMVVAALRTLARFHHDRLTLTVNDEQARLDTPLLFVGNNDYRIDIGAPGHRDSLQDGKLCVLVMRKKTRRGLIAASIRALLNRTRPDDMVRLDDVARLRVASRRKHLPISVDGEVTALTSPLDYRVRKRALKVIAPED